MKTLIPFTRALSTSQRPPFTITLAVGISTYEFERNTNVQVIKIAEHSSQENLTSPRANA